MDNMELSTIHIKAPHEIHIGAKVMAAKRSTSMNQYVVDLIKADMEGNNVPPVEVRQGIKAFRKASPKQKKVIEKATKVMDDLLSVPGVQPASEAICPRHLVPFSVCEHKH